MLENPGFYTRLPGCLRVWPRLLRAAHGVDHMTISWASGAVWSAITRSLGEKEISASELMIRSLIIASQRSRFRICTIAAGLQAAGGQWGGGRSWEMGDGAGQLRGRIGGCLEACTGAGIPHPAFLVSHPSWVSDVCRANKVAVRRRRYLASASEGRMKTWWPKKENGFSFSCTDRDRPAVFRPSVFCIQCSDRNEGRPRFGFGLTKGQPVEPATRKYDPSTPATGRDLDPDPDPDPGDWERGGFVGGAGSWRCSSPPINSSFDQHHPLRHSPRHRHESCGRGCCLVVENSVAPSFFSPLRFSYLIIPFVFFLMLFDFGPTW